MQPTSDLSRREFLAASTGALAATGLAAPADAAPANSLAIDGGPKAVKERVAPLVRWGEVERQQLNVAASQAVRPADHCTYWFYMLRLRPEALRCNRADFVKALVAEGVSASAGYIPVPLYANPVFQAHGFFAGRWPVKQFGLTSMDYTRWHAPKRKKSSRLASAS